MINPYLYFGGGTIQLTMTAAHTALAPLHIYTYDFTAGGSGATPLRAWNEFRHWRFKNTVSDGSVYIRLPDARRIPVGGPIYFMENYSATGTEVWVQDFDGTTVAVIEDGNPAIPGASEGVRVCFFLTDNSTSAGSWFALQFHLDKLFVAPTTV